MGAYFSTNFFSRTSSCTSFCVWESEQAIAEREGRSAFVGSPFLLARAPWACTLGVEVPKPINNLSHPAPLLDVCA